MTPPVSGWYTCLLPAATAVTIRSKAGVSVKRATRREGKYISKNYRDGGEDRSCKRNEKNARNMRGVE